MVKLTITVPKSVARWARVWAARRKTSVSMLVSELLTACIDRERTYDAAMKRHLGKPPTRLRQPGESYPRREQLHER